jgi:CheY-like chemotaxis protein
MNSEVDLPGSGRSGMIAMMVGRAAGPTSALSVEFGQRRFVRFPVAVAVTGKALQFPDRSLRGTVRDIGRGGLMAEFPVTLVPGSLIQVSLNTPSGPIQETGRVIWAAKARQAVRHGLAFPEVKPRGFPAAVRDDRGLASDPSRGRRAILVVDDDAQLREVASVMLETAGYRPLASRDGLEALGHLRRYLTDVAAVLLNLHLPGESAAELYDSMRLLHPEVPVFLTSGEPEESALARFGRSGIAGFLYKPAGIPAWVAKIEAALAETAEETVHMPAP